MYKSGYKDITNIDISDVIIDKMKNNYKTSCPEMKCKTEYNVGLIMDATSMNFPDSSFDLVIDKGTYDALSVNLN